MRRREARPEKSLSVLPRRFPKAVRLCSRADFLRVKAEGASFAGRLMVVGVLKKAPSSRAGIIITKRVVRRAVDRNRIRRRLRELLRLSLLEWAPGVWVVLIVRQGALEASFEALRVEWHRLARRAGVFGVS